LREAFADAARGLPELWQQGVLSQRHKKALLRCFIDKVVIHRIVWRGGEATSTAIPVVVASIARLSCGRETERVALELARQGQSDEIIAAELTRRGYRSPRERTVIPNTVRGIRLRHRVLRPRPGSRPRRVPGKLTVPEVARALGVQAHWLYQRLDRGVIETTFDAERNLYVFPDIPETLKRLRKLKAGRIQRVRL